MTTNFIVYSHFVFKYMAPIQPYNIVLFRQEGEMWPYGKVEFRLFLN